MIEYTRMNEVPISVDNLDMKPEPGEDALVSWEFFCYFYYEIKQSNKFITNWYFITWNTI